MRNCNNLNCECLSEKKCVTKIINDDSGKTIIKTTKTNQGYTITRDILKKSGEKIYYVKKYNNDGKYTCYYKKSVVFVRNLYP